MLAICAKPAKKACFIGYKAECINKQKKMLRMVLTVILKGGDHTLSQLGIYKNKLAAQAAGQTLPR